MAGNQQPRVLQALDVARTQWYHFTAIAIAGMGFFTDAYDLFSISLVVDVIGYRYYGYRGGRPPRGVSAAISVIALCGTVPGQLVFGWLGDKMGRKRIYGYTLILMVACSLASGFSFSKRTGKSVVTVLCFFRFWLGVSIGGDFYTMLDIFMLDIFTIFGVLPSPEESGNQVTRMIRATGLHTAVALGGTLPGYFFAVAFIDRVGRIKIQLLGFTMMTVFTLCLAIPYDQWQEPKNRVGFVIMLGFTFFFANFGPNTTTFILPAEIFPARMRSTCHGISGAVGKVGAILGVLAFSFMGTHFKALLFVIVGCNLVGIMFTLLLPETKGKSLEEITGEMEECQPLDDKAGLVDAAQGIHAVSI
ncbi:hypothetical protein QYE76_038162 [Lolium multiflorum]|uniref:H(+)/Pi cotransporter n=1 Tax=Lolium multiflorum TaxID=4521 RepID=A0AAD8WR00_LOLMU|nr:hypothetical protein QYE76_038162 [Lolium multiflorum]